MSASNSGLVLWLDTSDVSTLGLDNNNNVSVWRDKITNKEASAYFATGATKCVYSNDALSTGKSGIIFNSGNGMSSGFSFPMPSGTLNAGSTVFIVFKSAANVANKSKQCLISRTDPATNMPSPFDMKNKRIYVGDGTSYVDIVDSNNTGVFADGVSGYVAPYILSMLQTVSVDQDNTSTAEVRIGNLGMKEIAYNFGDTGDTINIGTNRLMNTMFDGVISEVLVYNKYMNRLQHDDVVYYLSLKWGIAPVIKPIPQPTIVPAALPTSQDGLVLWLDAGDINTISKDTRNAVMGWKDKMRGRTAIPYTTVDSYGIYDPNALSAGKPGISFNSINGKSGFMIDMEPGTLVNGYTVIIMFKSAQTVEDSETQCLISRTDPISGLAGPFDMRNNFIYIGNGTATGLNAMNGGLDFTAGTSMYTTPTIIRFSQRL